MIVSLHGIVAEKLGGLVILNVHGVGYGLLVPVEDYGHLNVGDKTKIYIYEYIRENAYDLYGFTSLDTKQLFEQLLDVTGVGPKMAISVLNVASSNQLRAAIADGDTKLIQAANGVGKRVAERIVVELKDKVGLVVGSGADAVLLSSETSQQDEAVQALLALGYNLPDAISSLTDIDPKLPTEARVKQALKGGMS
ncbi:Holliday junction branch migration protein RuvA [Candidatus Saccharibacteria bacterium]|nr:Holliday junction branch migration protein RuvA [Candidatus Saccharibacteria bacterium]